MAILGHHTQCKRMSEVRFKIELRSQAMIKTAKKTYFAFFILLSTRFISWGRQCCTPGEKERGDTSYKELQ